MISPSDALLKDHILEDNLYKLIFESTNQAFILIDSETHQIKFSNEAFFKIFGKSDLHEDDVFPLIGLIYPNDRRFVTDRFYRFTAGENIHEINYRINAGSDGLIKWITCKFFPLKHKVNNRSYFACNIEDITRRKSYEIAKEKVSETRQYILDILGHDLRSPFSRIKALTSLIKVESKHTETGNIQEYLYHIDKTCMQASSLLENLLEISRLESSEIKLYITRENLVSIIKESIENMESFAMEKNIQVNLSLPDDKVRCPLDKDKFKLVVQNLLSNAIKFSYNGKKVDVSIRIKNNYVYLMIMDYGTGIEEKQIPYIFNKFSKVRKQGTAGEKSTGLGLVITKKIVELHKGSITVKSEPDKGSTFIIRLPLAANQSSLNLPSKN